MQSHLVTLTAIWAFVATPLLCTGGYLEHACECPSESDAACCPSFADTCCPEGDAGCGHESACQTDPCEIDVVKPGRLTDEVDDAGRVSPVHASMTDLWWDAIPRTDSSRCALDGPIAFAKRRSIHERALPLLN